ncbi:MAG: site-2 protease family protein [Candidatus Methanomethylophilaceae archaeon]|nr:site-2 protease family protein [Candidatus Methanomethylophilaceae archaeon]
MNTAYLVLLILAIIYIPIYIWVWKSPQEAERYHLAKYGPAIMIKTGLGIKSMERLGRHTLLCRTFGFVSKVLSAILLLMMLYMLIVAFIAIPSRIGQGSIGIEYALAIPGFNPIMPLSYGVAALFIAMVVHEFAHGVQSRSNDVDVQSTGLLYGVVPLGAFVEPDEEQMKTKPRRVKMDVYTAGISINTIVAAISITLMVLACSAVSSPYEGDAGVYSVDADSPAYIGGIPSSAIIESVKEEGADSFVDVTTKSKGNLFAIDYPFDPTKRYVLRYVTEEGAQESGPIQMGTFVKAISTGSPADKNGIPYGVLLYKVITGDEEFLVSDPIGFSDFMAGTSPGDVVTVVTVSVMDADGNYET